MVLKANKSFTAWAAVLKLLDAISDDQDRYLRTVVYLNSLDSTKTNYLEGDVKLYISSHCSIGGQATAKPTRSPRGIMLLRSYGQPSVKCVLLARLSRRK